MLKSNLVLRQVLQNIYVQYDLLELMDYTNINPDLYTHGLMTETTQQLVGLQRRKNALHLLSATIEKRLNDDDEQKTEEHPKSASADFATVADSIQTTQASSTRLPVVTDNSTNGLNKNKRDFESTAASDRGTDSLTTVANPSHNIDVELTTNEEPATKRQRT